MLAHPIQLIARAEPLVVDLPGEHVFTIDVESPWELYFDGASHTHRLILIVYKQEGPE